MTTDEGFVRRMIDAVDFVRGDVAVNPLHARAQAAQHPAGFPGDRLEFGRTQLAGASDLSLDDEFGHELSPQMMIGSPCRRLGEAKRCWPKPRSVRSYSLAQRCRHVLKRA